MWAPNHNIDWSALGMSRGDSKIKYCSVATLLQVWFCLPSVSEHDNRPLGVTNIGSVCKLIGSRGSKSGRRNVCNTETSERWASSGRIDTGRHFKFAMLAMQVGQGITLSSSERAMVSSLYLSCLMGKTVPVCCCTADSSSLLLSPFLGLLAFLGNRTKLLVYSFSRCAFAYKSCMA